MKLLVCTNHAEPFHVGGSEKVIKQVTESMTSEFGMECCVLAKIPERSRVVNGVTVAKVDSSPVGFLKQVEDFAPDCILTYSDYFLHWPTLLENAEKIKAKQVIALVGANRTRSDRLARDLLLKKKDLFNVVVHAKSYVDYKFCEANEIKATVIPNAIDLNEFADQGFSFRNKYNIETPKMILCVSNFFPGKGQEFLLRILGKLQFLDKDWTAVFVASPLQYMVAGQLMNNFKIMTGRMNLKHRIRLLVGIPRHETVQAFREADVFAFPSQQEVAPLVIMESMACKTPWVALNVGNLADLPGGTLIFADKTVDGLACYNERVFKEFESALNATLLDKQKHDALGSAGYDYIFSHHNWDQIKMQYKTLFEM